MCRMTMATHRPFLHFIISSIQVCLLKSKMKSPTLGNLIVSLASMFLRKSLINTTGSIRIIYASNFLRASLTLLPLNPSSLYLP